MTTVKPQVVVTMFILSYTWLFMWPCHHFQQHHPLLSNDVAVVWIAGVIIACYHLSISSVSLDYHNNGICIQQQINALCNSMVVYFWCDLEPSYLHIFVPTLYSVAFATNIITLQTTSYFICGWSHPPSIWLGDLTPPLWDTRVLCQVTAPQSLGHRIT